MVNPKVISSMPLQQGRCETSCIIFLHSIHSKTPSRWQSSTFQCLALVQDHQPLPSLLQRPIRLCLPVPSTYIAESVPSPAISESRGNHSSSSASDVLRLMDGLQLPVEADTYAYLLQECARSRDFLQGSSVHAHIRRRFTGGRSLLRQPAGLFLANRLLVMYAACHQAKLAQQLFDQMPLRDSISRVITMSSLSENNDDLGALQLFVGMHPGREDWWLVDPLGFRVVLWTCVRARELHGLVVKLTGCSSFIEYMAPLIRFYAMLECPDLSLQLMLASPDDCEEAAWVSIVILTACVGANEEKEGYEGGQQVHVIAIKIGVDGDPYVGCRLVELYSKQGLLIEARKALEMVDFRRRLEA
ncbi:Pentatricopeptide repeat-containing protein [Dendrobium catenatum]|uniref:Pentatricopeptide repeat-containing protein n=1 Tax=Dendrobium catenatum TaxID=906689 RepID=A0A2I0WZY2_9ASPA|nr:Pentatricopeptide repeat-containing protein [Dendrobium catenatum]